MDCKLTGVRPCSEDLKRGKPRRRVLRSGINLLAIVLTKWD